MIGLELAHFNLRFTAKRPVHLLDVRIEEDDTEGLVFVRFDLEVEYIPGTARSYPWIHVNTKNMLVCGVSGDIDPQDSIFGEFLQDQGLYVFEYYEGLDRPGDNFTLRLA